MLYKETQITAFAYLVHIARPAIFLFHFVNPIFVFGDVLFNLKGPLLMLYRFLSRLNRTFLVFFVSF